MTPLHYPSLELCKKLTEAGFPRTTMFTQQSSYFMENWYIVMNTKTRDELFDPRCFENWSTTADMKKEIVYPSVMELLDEMPTYDLTFMDDAHWVIRHTSDHTECGTLPNALAEMWLWIKENNYLPK